VRVPAPRQLKWTSLGGSLSSKPGAVAVSSNTYSVYVRGSDGAVWGPGWHSLGGSLTTGTGGSSNGSTPFAYALGSNSQVWQHSDLASGRWSQVTP
jgi:hypothetical protein